MGEVKVKDNDATSGGEAGRYPQPVLHRQIRTDSSELIWQEGELPAAPRCITERFLHWAVVDPDRLWMAERDGQGGWRRMSYGEAAGRSARWRRCCCLKDCRSNGPC